MSLFTEAGVYSSILAGLIIAAAFPLGALFAIFLKYPSRVEADIGSFGAGIFFAAISFSLVNESVREGNVLTMIAGFVAGAIVFSILNHYLKKLTSKNTSHNNPLNNLRTNKYKSKYKNNEEEIETGVNDTETGETGGTSGKIVVAGLLLDSIPEALFVGIIIALAHGQIAGVVAALFLGNLVTTMEGAKRMSDSGMSVSKIMMRWSFVLLVVAISAPLGYFLVDPLNKDEISVLVGFAAGILITFITEELIPEAYRKANFHIGLSTTFGFLSGYILFHFL